MPVPPSSDYYSRNSIESRIGKSVNRDWYVSKLDGIGFHSSKLQKERFDLAVSYIETHCTKLDAQNRPIFMDGKPVVDREMVRQQLDTIDFHSEVKIRDFKKGERLSQHRFSEESISRDKLIQSASDKRLGEFFTDRNTPTQQLGLATRSPAQSRPISTVSAKHDFCALETRTRGTIDVWSKYRAVRVPRKKSKDGTIIRPGDRKHYKITRTDGKSQSGSVHLRPTKNAKFAVSRYQSVTYHTKPRVLKSGEKKPSVAKKRIYQTSGEYVSGGAKQYHIFRATQHKHLQVVRTRSRSTRKR